jgi:threonylcarbamoyladenosine tRNA methylthiotransferase MtaB
MVNQIGSRITPAINILTLGCKLNQAESEELGQRFHESGFIVNTTPPADVYIINTCTVTSTADQKSRHILRRLRRLSPDSLIIVTGCYAQRSADEIVNARLADLVVANTEKLSLPLILQRKLGLSLFGSSAGFIHPRTRSFVKIQEGCQVKCTYCVVPTVRKSESSVSQREIVERINSASAAGIHEVVLTGTRIGAYSFERMRLSGLVRSILAETTVDRIRLSSLQPAEIDDNLLGLWENPRLCPHIHLALQSGSDRTLESMRRPYDTASFKRAVESFRSRISNAAVTTDIMVGFPGETDDQFEESLRYCREIGFAHMHAFAYSPRPGTPAAGYNEQVPESVKRRRLLFVLSLARTSARNYRQQLIETTLPVLWESKSKSSETISGLTSNYIRVETVYRPGLENTITGARLTALKGQSVEAEIV